MKKKFLKLCLIMTSLFVVLSAQAQYNKQSCLATGPIGAYMCAVQKNQQNCLIMKGAGYNCDWGVQKFSCVTLLGGNGAMCAYQKNQKNCEIVAQQFRCAWLAKVVPY